MDEEEEKKYIYIDKINDGVDREPVWPSGKALGW